MACYQSLNLHTHSLWRILHCFQGNFSRTLRVGNTLSSFKKSYVIRPSPFQTIKGYCSLSGNLKSTLPVALHATSCGNAVISTKKEQVLHQEAVLGTANLQEIAVNANSSNGRVMLIDGTSVIYRAYYKLLAKLHHGYLSHADGNGDWVLTIFTALSLIIDVLEFVPSHVAVVFDHDGIPFGHTSISSKENVMAKVQERQPQPPAAGDDTSDDSMAAVASFLAAQGGSPAAPTEAACCCFLFLLFCYFPTAARCLHRPTFSLCFRPSPQQQQPQHTTGSVSPFPWFASGRQKCCGFFLAAVLLLVFLLLFQRSCGMVWWWREDY